MEKDIKLDLQVQKGEMPIIALSFSREGKEKMLAHICSLSEEELELALCQLEEYERRK